MTDKNEPGTGSSPADDWADALAEQSRACLLYTSDAADEL